MPVFLYIRIGQTRPKSERLNETLNSWPLDYQNKFADSFTGL